MYRTFFLEEHSVTACGCKEDVTLPCVNGCDDFIFQRCPLSDHFMHSEPPIYGLPTYSLTSIERAWYYYFIIDTLYKLGTSLTSLKSFHPPSFSSGREARELLFSEAFFRRSGEKGWNGTCISYLAGRKKVYQLIFHAEAALLRCRSSAALLLPCRVVGYSGNMAAFGVKASGR